jgi:hypothetical protein
VMITEVTEVCSVVHIEQRVASRQVDRVGEVCPRMGT